mgnify:CR=1 FL=1
MPLVDELRRVAQAQPGPGVPQQQLAQIFLPFTRLNGTRPGDGGFGLDYYGFVEGTDIAKGTVDVVVTDGFTGNIALKTAEGTASVLDQSVIVSGRALTVNEALREYIQRRQQARVIELFGKVDFDPQYNYKTQRSRR